MTASPRGRAPGDGRYGEAFFRPGQAGESERIDFGALAYDDITMARLREIGAGPGLTCWRPTSLPRASSPAVSSSSTRASS